MIRELVRSVAGYPGLLLMCMLSGIVLPLPEDFPLVYAGVAIAEGRFTWAPTLAVAIVGVGLRDAFVYGVGRYLGVWLLESERSERWFKKERIQRAEKMVRDRGPQAVLIGRFLIGFRAPVFLVAGACKLSFRKFIFWDTLGMMLAVPGMIWLGWAFGEQITDMMFWLNARSREVLIMAVLATALYTVRQLRRSSEAS